MAGPEGFDASLIETEALLKKMKPRPANLSAARIVYEAGRAVGREEMQAQLVGSGMVMATVPANAAWKKWVVRSWAGGATVVCLILLCQFAIRGPQKPENSDLGVNGASNPVRSQGFGSPGFAGPSPFQPAQPFHPRGNSTPTEVELPENHFLGAPSSGGGVHTAASNSENQSGSVRDARPSSEPRKREKNLADYIRDQLPSIESKRNLDPLEIRDNRLQPPGSGGPMALTTLGFIKTP